MPDKFGRYILGIVLLISFQSVDRVQAQILYQESPHFSTYDWTQNLRLQILDKTHAYGDILYDRGFTRVLTPLTKHEYELDMMTQEFNFGDQFMWYKEGLSGLRTRFGSHDKGKWATFTELHVDSELSDKTTLGLHTYLQQHARANRALFEFSYKRQIAEDHSIYIQQTIAEYKKDVDATLSYRYRNDKFGHIRFDLTYQDYLNNIVNEVGNDSYFETEEEASRNFQEEVLSPNTLFMGRWNSPGTKRFHWDVSFIVQPWVKKNIFNNAEETFSVDSKEWLYVLNGIVDVNFGPLTVGVFGYKTLNKEERTGTAGQVPVNYTTKQINTKVGFIASASWWRISPLFKISREYYNDNQVGENGGISVIDQEFNFKERRWMLDTGFGYKLSEVVFITTRYQSQLRTTNDDLLQLQRSQEIHNLVRNWGQFYVDNGRRLDNRISLQITLHPHQKVRVQVFGAFDLDADTNRYTDRIQRFDKGGAKLIVALD